jgi:hypothetical protein
VAWLDCTDLKSASASLADALDLEEVNLRNAFEAYDETVFADMSQDPRTRMPCEVCETLNRDISFVHFEGATYFHATRVVDPDGFYQRGILPLGGVIEPIWQMLFALVQDECTPAEWTEFRGWVEAGGGGPDGGLYRFKANDPDLHGPFGILVREMFFRRGEVNISNFLECPEIIQDIARCFEKYRGVDLESYFYETSAPVIVSFRGPFTGLGSVCAAFWYVYNEVRDGSVSNNSDCCYDGSGSPVLPDQIVSVEVIGQLGR